MFVVVINLNFFLSKWQEEKNSLKKESAKLTTVQQCQILQGVI